MASNQTSRDNPLAQDFSNYNHKEMKDKVHVSSLKIFDGEDLTAGNRKRLQQLQQKDWIDQQIQEKQERLNFLKQTHQEYDQQGTQINNMAVALENAENQKRRELEKATKEYNLQMTYEKFDKSRDQHQKEQNSNQEHIDYCKTNNFQTENTQTCQSQLAEHRYIPYHWKGMNPQEKLTIRQQQEQQQEEQRMLDQQKKDEERLYALQAQEQRFMNINLERERARQHQQKLNEVKEFNLLAAKEQKLKIKTMYD